MLDASYKKQQIIKDFFLAVKICSHLDQPHYEIIKIELQKFADLLRNNLKLEVAFFQIKTT